jgi:hypothetical protein
MPLRENKSPFGPFGAAAKKITTYTMERKIGITRPPSMKSHRE